jgi:hypothetical protein
MPTLYEKLYPDTTAEGDVEYTEQRDLVGANVHEFQGPRRVRFRLTHRAGQNPRRQVLASDAVGYMEPVFTWETKQEMQSDVSGGKATKKLNKHLDVDADTSKVKEFLKQLYDGEFK